jgi:hypothetical protein
VDKLLLSDAERSLFDVARELLAPRLELGDDLDSARWRSEFFFSRAASIYGGCAEIQRDLLAEHLLGLPRVR